MAPIKNNIKPIIAFCWRLADLKVFSRCTNIKAEDNKIYKKYNIVPEVRIASRESALTMSNSFPTSTSAHANKMKPKIVNTMM